MQFGNTNRQRGFTLLLAALISSLVLSLGISVVSIARKSVTLSSISRDSQFAFYSADSAAECALYWDVRFNYFGTSTPAGLEPPDDPECDGVKIEATGRQSAEPYVMSFEYEPEGYCVQVEVRKNVASPRTVIHADGFSVSCNEITTNSRSLQRSVELRY
jgi:hypothetical protein